MDLTPLKAEAVEEEEAVGAAAAEGVVAEEEGAEVTWAEAAAAVDLRWVLTNSHSLSSITFISVFQIEMMVPGNKVGLVIGKGGETIKQLQEKSGAKLVIIQEGPETEMEKALRITGDPQTIEVFHL